MSFNFPFCRSEPIAARTEFILTFKGYPASVFILSGLDQPTSTASFAPNDPLIRNAGPTVAPATKKGID